MALTLFQSGKEKSRNTIILNPGGPGGSGTYFAYAEAERLDALLGGGYDILGFDPRGEKPDLQYLSDIPFDSKD